MLFRSPRTGKKNDPGRSSVQNFESRDIKFPGRDIKLPERDIKLPEREIKNFLLLNRGHISINLSYADSFRKKIAGISLFKKKTIAHC